MSATCSCALSRSPRTAACAPRSVASSACTASAACRVASASQAAASSARTCWQRTASSRTSSAATRGIASLLAPPAAAARAASSTSVVTGSSGTRSGSACAAPASWSLRRPSRPKRPPRRLRLGLASSGALAGASAGCRGAATSGGLPRAVLRAGGAAGAAPLPSTARRAERSAAFRASTPPPVATGGSPATVCTCSHSSPAEARRAMLLLRCKPGAAASVVPAAGEASVSSAAHPLGGPDRLTNVRPADAVLPVGLGGPHSASGPASAASAEPWRLSVATSVKIAPEATSCPACTCSGTHSRGGRAGRESLSDGGRELGPSCATCLARGSCASVSEPPRISKGSTVGTGSVLGAL